MRRPHGFSLVELLVVVALAALLAGIGASVIGGALPGKQLRDSARALAADLRYTRARAIASGREQVFRLDVDARAWTGADGRTGGWPEGLEVTTTTAREEQDARRVAVVRFFPSGAASGGRVVLRRGDAAWHVDVAWLTGEVALRRGAGEP